MPETLYRFVLLIKICFDNTTRPYFNAQKHSCIHMVPVSWKDISTFVMGCCVLLTWKISGFTTRKWVCRVPFMCKWKGQAVCHFLYILAAWPCLVVYIFPCVPACLLWHPLHSKHKVNPWVQLTDLCTRDVLSSIIMQDCPFSIFPIT